MRSDRKGSRSEDERREEPKREEDRGGQMEHQGLRRGVRSCEEEGSGESKLVVQKRPVSSALLRGPRAWPREEGAARVGEGRPISQYQSNIAGAGPTTN